MLCNSFKTWEVYLMECASLSPVVLSGPESTVFNSCPRPSDNCRPQFCAPEGRTWAALHRGDVIGLLGKMSRGPGGCKWHSIRDSPLGKGREVCTSEMAPFGVEGRQCVLRGARQEAVRAVWSEAGGSACCVERGSWQRVLCGARQLTVPAAWSEAGGSWQ